MYIISSTYTTEYMDEVNGVYIISSLSLSRVHITLNCLLFSKTFIHVAPKFPLSLNIIGELCTYETH